MSPNGYHPCMGLFSADRAKHARLSAEWVVPEPSRCVQCGVCSFNCPMGIDVRRHVWRAEPVSDAACIACGECVKRCPRGLLRFQPMSQPLPSDFTQAVR